MYINFQSLCKSSLHTICLKFLHFIPKEAKAKSMLFYDSCSKKINNSLQLRQIVV